MTATALTAHRPHLLVVDDEANIAELLRIWFEPALVEKAKLIVRNAEEQDTRRAQNPIGNPA